MFWTRWIHGFFGQGSTRKKIHMMSKFEQKMRNKVKRGNMPRLAWPEACLYVAQCMARRLYTRGRSSVQPAQPTHCWVGCGPAHPKCAGTLCLILVWLRFALLTYKRPHIVFVSHKKDYFWEKEKENTLFLWKIGLDLTFLLEKDWRSMIADIYRAFLWCGSLVKGGWHLTTQRSKLFSHRITIRLVLVIYF